MNRVENRKSRCAGLTLAVAIGAAFACPAHASPSQKQPKGEEWTLIASVPNEFITPLTRFFDSKHIRCMISGSLSFGIEVPAAQASRALQILREPGIWNRFHINDLHYGVIYSFASSDGAGPFQGDILESIRVLPSPEEVRSKLIGLKPRGRDVYLQSVRNKTDLSLLWFSTMSVRYQRAFLNMFVDECRHRDLVGPYATAAERSEWDIRKLDILAAANREPDRLTRDGKGLEWRPPAWALLAKAERLIARGTYDLQPRPDEWHLRTPAHLGTRKASLRT